MGVLFKWILYLWKQALLQIVLQKQAGFHENHRLLEISTGTLHWQREQSWRGVISINHPPSLPADPSPHSKIPWSSGAQSERGEGCVLLLRKALTCNIYIFLRKWRLIHMFVGPSCGIILEVIFFLWERISHGFWGGGVWGHIPSTVLWLCVEGLQWSCSPLGDNGDKNVIYEKLVCASILWKAYKTAAPLGPWVRGLKMHPAPQYIIDLMQRLETLCTDSIVFTFCALVKWFHKLVQVLQYIQKLSFFLCPLNHPPTEPSSRNQAWILCGVLHGTCAGFSWIALSKPASHQSWHYSLL